MERFTYKDESGNWVIACNRFWNYVKLKLPSHLRGESVDRLAEYESTGMEPEEIKKIATDVESGFLHETARRYGIGIDRLRELAKADRDGRCMVLPSREYSNEDGERALKNAMYVVGLTNNGVNRYIADAVAEKLTREDKLKEKRKE